MTVISLVSLLSQPQSKMNTPGTSSTVWLTKAVDISVSYPVHVVVYTVPTCPADASQANLTHTERYYTLSPLFGC